MSPSTAPRWLLPALFAASLAIFFWGLGSIPLLSFNEARRAVPVREMLVSGDWLLPTLNGHLYISKPPLLYWLAGIPAWLFQSASEWVVRLPSALAAFLTTWLTFFSLRRRFGLAPAVLAVLILVTSAGYTAFARRSEIEMLLAACCFGSVLAAFEYIFGGQQKRWLDIAFLCLGLGLLTKGPVTLLFYVPMLLVFWWRYRDKAALDCLTHWRGWVLAIVIGGFWYLLVSLKLGWDIWSHVVETDIAGKVEKAKTDPLYQYPLWLLVDFLPWCLLALVAPVRNFRRWLADPKSGFFLIAALVPLVIFSLFANKHAKYLLPTYPAWAALLALTVAEFHGKLKGRGRQVFHTGCVVLVLGFIAYYAKGEARVLVYRYQSLPKIITEFARHPQLPVYAWQEIDPRVIYYRGGPITVISTEVLGKKLQEKESLLLFAEEDLPQKAKGDMCLLAEFSPYLKPGHKAALFGNGEACR